MFTAQEGFNVPPCVRRCADIWALYKNRDMDAVTALARKGGLRKDDLHAIFDAYRFGARDSLWIDTTANTPYPLRINGDQLLTEEEVREIAREYNQYKKMSAKGEHVFKRYKSVSSALTFQPDESRQEKETPAAAVSH
jgi:hypothetical protein